jgi:hypothetical protein
MCWRRCWLSASSASSSRSIATTDRNFASSFTRNSRLSIEADLIVSSGAWREGWTRCLWTSWGSEWRRAATATGASSTCTNERHDCRAVAMSARAWSVVGCRCSLMVAALQCRGCFQMLLCIENARVHTLELYANGSELPPSAYMSFCQAFCMCSRLVQPLSPPSLLLTTNSPLFTFRCQVQLKMHFVRLSSLSAVVRCLQSFDTFRNAYSC